MNARLIPVETIEVIDPAGRIEPLALLRRLGWLALAVVAAWGVLLVGWAWVAPISGAVVGAGLVKVEANRQTITHRDGGIVAKILVREGQLVKRGQTLVLLEDTRIDSSVDLLVVQLATERLRKSRLEAQAGFAPRWSVPDREALLAAGPRVREALAREQFTFDAKQRTLQGQADSIRSQLRDTEAEITARQRDSVTAGEALRLMRDELVSNEALLEQNFVSRTRVMSLKRGVAEYESRIQSNEAEFAKARQKRAELEGRLVSVKDAYAQQAAEEIAEATAKIVDLEERLRAGRDTAGRQAVLAPADGRLVGLKVNTVGSAIGPREPIVDIVPADAPLVVEIHVGADAISEIVPGLPAEVKLLAYKQRITKLLAAKVSSVSADALIDPRSGAPYFAVQVEIAPEALAAPGQPALISGMAAEAYIKTGARTPFEFLFEPIFGSMRRSFREH